jgi:hypothetical protein
LVLEKAKNAQTFIFRHITEITIEYDDQHNIVYIDQEKAVNRVDRNELWNIIEHYSTHG